MAQFFHYILELKQDTMKSMRFLVLAFGAALMVACGSSSPLGDQVKEPFSSSKYESTKRYWRAVGKGSSKDDNIAKSKADLQAKKEIAQQVQTRMKVVSDQYFSDTETLNSEEVNDKFQSLAREVTNTQIADLRKIGEEKYFNGEIKSFDEKSGKHLVKYDSGEQRLMTIEQSKTKWLSKSQIQGEDAVGWRVSVGPPGHLSGSDPLFLSSSHSPLG